MAEIKVLPQKLIELIAAGEVVERPSSVIKELVENSIDAGAQNITVEIQNGGITYMRVTDNGCGISAKDIRTAFLSHATSKIKDEKDLYSIGTLGFRGEALASICAVSKVSVLTRTKSSDLGTHYCIEGGRETLFEEIGCPKGTNIVIKDIFYNTPARMKFLKKDVSEANLVSALMDRIALSHPEVAFKLIRDGKQTLNTSGDGKVESAVYSVQGREYHAALLPIAASSDNGVTVTGFVGKPTYCKSNRNGQFCYLNGRLVKSATVCAALEQAYRNRIMTGKFPVCVINVEMPFDMVDVNVHPAKTEVRFSNEKQVFDSVYYAVKATLIAQTERPEMELPTQNIKPAATFETMTADEFKKEFSAGGVFENKSRADVLKSPLPFKEERAVQTNIDIDIEYEPPKAAVICTESKDTVTENIQESEDFTVSQKIEPDNQEPEYEKPQEEIKLVGEAFKTYVIAQKGEALYIIDKHAAHERIIYDRLKNEMKPEKQFLIAPQTVVLNREDYNTVTEQPEALDKIGFEIEDLSDGMIMVRTVPAALIGDDIAEMMGQIAAALQKGSSAAPDRLERIYCTVACRAAIKAGDKSGEKELLKLANDVLGEGGVMYCPHGRPVAFEIKRKDLEKQFGRLQ